MKIPMFVLNGFAASWVRRFQTLLGLLPLLLRYCFYLMSFRRLAAHSVHDFSQLMIFSPRMRRRILQGKCSRLMVGCICRYTVHGAPCTPRRRNGRRR